MKKITELIKDISDGKNLSFDESKLIFLSIMSGNISEDLIFKFLTSLSKKGETADEIAGGVYVLREKSLKVKAPENIIDTCGTGGDGKNTLNISTASSLLLATKNSLSAGSVLTVLWPVLLSADLYIATWRSIVGKSAWLMSQG